MNLNVFTEKDAERVASAVKKTSETAESIARRGVERGRATPQVTEDDLYSKVLKYIPAPLIGLYLFLANLVLNEGSNDQREIDLGMLGSFSTTGKQALLWILVALFAVLTPIYLRRNEFQRTGQLLASVVAFLAFVAASSGPQQLYDWWHPWYASLILGLAVLLLLVFRPRPLPENVLQETVDAPPAAPEPPAAAAPAET